MDNDMVGKLLPGDKVRCEIKTKGKRTYVKSIGLLERIPLLGGKCQKKPLLLLMV
jgi:hypothetical protein